MRGDPWRVGALLGLERFGQVGDGTTITRLAPVAVSGVEAAVDVVTGSDYRCALLAGGVRCGGDRRRDTNHRYTSSVAIRAAMVARGGVAEGYGHDAVAMCAPP